MPDATFHLANVNIAHLVAPIDDPRIDGFVRELDAINAIAESSPGFIWRWAPPAGSPSDSAFDNDPTVIVNLSVWTTPATLLDFTYHSRHVEIYRQRAQWFRKVDLPTYCLWWIPRGHTPTTHEAHERLMHRRDHGVTKMAFSFPKLFPEPSNRIPTESA
jgi:hypothetical protein